MSPEGGKEFKRILNTSKNFIKPADKDPDATLTFNIETNILLLLDCTWIIVLNIDKTCAYSQSVISWCVYMYPELFDPVYIKLVHSLIIHVFDLMDFESIAADLKLYY